MVWFHSIKESSDLVQNQLERLAIYIYGGDRVKSRIFSSLSNPEDIVFKGTNFATASKGDLPSSLDELYLLYLNEPISDADRSEFLAMFGIPFMSTGKTVAELYRLNPDAFTDTLDALIRSKRIQRIQHNLYSLREQPPLPLERGEVRAALMRDVERLQSEYIWKYEEQEGEISAAWLKAIDLEPRFIAKNNAYKMTSMGVEGSKGGSNKRKTLRKRRRRASVKKARK